MVTLRWLCDMLCQGVRGPATCCTVLLGGVTASECSMRRNRLRLHARHGASPTATAAPGLRAACLAMTTISNHLLLWCVCCNFNAAQFAAVPVHIWEGYARLCLCRVPAPGPYTRAPAERSLCWMLELYGRLRMRLWQCMTQPQYMGSVLCCAVLLFSSSGP